MCPLRNQTAAGLLRFGGADVVTSAGSNPSSASMLTPLLPSKYAWVRLAPRVDRVVTWSVVVVFRSAI
jgi:hypothetical protein